MSLRYEQAEEMAAMGQWQEAASALTPAATDAPVNDDAAALRYEAAEKLLQEGKWEEAADIMESLGNYADSAERASLIRYQAAEQIFASGDWQRAVGIMESLGDYGNSAARALSMKYQTAMSLALKGEHLAAAEIYDGLGNYADSVSLARQARYDGACALRAAADFDGAIALFTLLGDYQDSAAQIPATEYARAQHAADQGDYLSAAQLFGALGAYSDASRQVEAMYDKYYGPLLNPVNQAYNEGRYTDAIAMLETLDLTRVPERYRDMVNVYRESCWREAEALLAAGKPYEALVYYQRIPGYKSVDSRLSRSWYLILGEWTDLQGNLYVFREDGTCSLNGEELSFTVDGDAMYTGDDPDLMAETHRLTGVNRQHAWLYDKRTGTEITIYLTRVEK